MQKQTRTGVLTVEGEWFLSRGHHDHPGKGRCAMAWAAHVDGEAHTDSPMRVSNAVRAFCVEYNDALADQPRQRLRPYLGRTLDTRRDGQDWQRSRICEEWLAAWGVPALLASDPKARGSLEMLLADAGRTVWGARRGLLQRCRVRRARKHVLGRLDAMIANEPGAVRAAASAVAIVEASDALTASAWRADKSRLSASPRSSGNGLRAGRRKTGFASSTKNAAADEARSRRGSSRAECQRDTHPGLTVLRWFVRCALRDPASLRLALALEAPGIGLHAALTDAGFALLDRMLPYASASTRVLTVPQPVRRAEHHHLALSVV